MTPAPNYAEMHAALADGLERHKQAIAWAARGTPHSSGPTETEIARRRTANKAARTSRRRNRCRA